MPTSSRSRRPAALARLDQLAQALTRSASSKQRLRASSRLSRLADPRVDVLLAALRVERDPAVRFDLVYGLAQLADRRAFQPFSRLIRSRREPVEVRALAAEMITRFDGEDAVPVLLDALAAPEPMLRFDAIWALASAGDERAVPGLELRVRDRERPYPGEPTVGQLARSTLAEIARRAVDK